MSNMARPKKDTTKQERLAFRTTAKLRYGLRLLAAKHRVSEGEMVSRCVEQALAAEGLNMTKLWYQGEADKLFALQRNAPEYLTDDDREILSQLEVIQAAFPQVIQGELLDKLVHHLGVLLLIDAPLEGEALIAEVAPIISQES